MKTLLPIEYGKRIKRARQAKNLTQRQLADLANLSDSAISKYEKQGTTDVNVLNSLSEVLGISLFSSPADAEGTIGVVGKEIMSILVLEGGYIDVETLVDEHMHGMDNDSVTDEIVTIEPASPSSPSVKFTVLVVARNTNIKRGIAKTIRGAIITIAV